ncbi:hypothetical protein KBG31_00995 [Patescibacteria group bacterium]|nr:hypothetical protein [Patescibacteria group bacterium]
MKKMLAIFLFLVLIFVPLLSSLGIPEEDSAQVPQAQAALSVAPPAIVDEPGGIRYSESRRESDPPSEGEDLSLQASDITFYGGDAWYTTQWVVQWAGAWIPLDFWSGFWRDASLDGPKGILKVHSNPQGWQRDVKIGSLVAFCGGGGVDHCLTGLVTKILVVGREKESQALALCDSEIALVTCKGPGLSPQERTVYCLDVVDGVVPGWGGW